MDKNLNNVLHKGETVLWHSAANPFPLLDSHQRNGARIILQWVAAVVLTAGVLWAYTSNNEGASPKFITAMLVVGALVLLAPIREWKTILGQQYLITDRRIMVLREYTALESQTLHSCRRSISGSAARSAAEMPWRKRAPNTEFGVGA